MDVAAVTTFFLVRSSSRGMSSRYAAVKAPEVMTRSSSVVFSVVFMISSILLELVTAIVTFCYLSPKARKVASVQGSTLNALGTGAGAGSKDGQPRKQLERSEAVERLERMEPSIPRTLELWTILFTFSMRRSHPDAHDRCRYPCRRMRRHLEEVGGHAVREVHSCDDRDAARGGETCRL